MPQHVELRLDHLRHLASGGTLEIDHDSGCIEIQIRIEDVVKWRDKKKMKPIASNGAGPGLISVKAE